MTKELFFDMWGPADPKDWDAFCKDLEKLLAPTEYLLTGWMTASGRAVIDVSRRNGNEWEFVKRKDMMPDKEWAEGWALQEYPLCKVCWLDDRGGMKN